MKKLLREPFLHFLALGAALFALNAWRSRHPSTANTDTPLIDVTEAVVERLHAGYEQQFNRNPDEDELRGLVRAHIREELLFREALALGLDRDDTIVRRRLAQKMEFLTDDLVGATDPDDTVLQRYFSENAGRYARPARVSFRHVYFSTERRGPAAEAAAREALSGLKEGVQDDALGDTFLQGFEFEDLDRAQVEAVFGPEFAAVVTAQAPGAWIGPVKSSFGLHLVRVESRSAPEPATFEAVREAVMRDYNDERRRTANQEVFERMMRRYRVTVDESAIRRAAHSPVRTAQVTP